jgi:hypothetical protein
MAKKGKLVKKLKSEMKDMATWAKYHSDTEKRNKARDKCIAGGGRWAGSKGCVKSTK